MLSLGLLVFWLDYAAVYWAETRISSGLTAILFSTTPLTTSLLSAYWTRSETLSGRKIAGILVGVVGTLESVAGGVGNTAKLATDSVTPALVNVGATLSGITAGLRRLVGGRRGGSPDSGPVSSGS